MEYLTFSSSLQRVVGAAFRSLVSDAMSEDLKLMMLSVGSIETRGWFVEGECKPDVEYWRLMIVFEVSELKKGIEE